MNVFILTLWTLVDPLHWVQIRTRSDKLRNPLESQGFCSYGMLMQVFVAVLCLAGRSSYRRDAWYSSFSDSIESWLVFGCLIGALHFALLAVAAYICYCARNIPSNYIQHKVITIALLSSFQMFIVGSKSIKSRLNIMWLFDCSMS